MGAEKNFERKVKTFIKDEGCWFIKYWGGGQFTTSGVPDILCCCKGRFLGIELKSEKGKPSDLQIHNLEAIDKAGGFAILLYPSDYQTFVCLIASLMISDYRQVSDCYQILKGRWKE